MSYFNATINRSRIPLSQNQKRSLRMAQDDKTGGIPLVLALAIGMPIQCTKSVSFGHHLANGTITRVVKIQMHQDDRQTEVQEEGKHYIIFTHTNSLRSTT